MFNPNVVLKSVVEKASVQAIVSLFARAFLAYLFIVSGWRPNVLELVAVQA